MADSYADHPQSVAELRSDKSRNAADWTPRDVLISVLRKIDSGEIKPDVLVLSMGTHERPGVTSHDWSASSASTFASLGVLARTMHLLQMSAEPVE